MRASADRSPSHPILPALLPPSLPRQRCRPVDPGLASRGSPKNTGGREGGKKGDFVTVDEGGGGGGKKRGRILSSLADGADARG